MFVKIKCVTSVGHSQIRINRYVISSFAKVFLYCYNLSLIPFKHVASICMRMEGKQCATRFIEILLLFTVSCQIYVHNTIAYVIKCHRHKHCKL